MQFEKFRLIILHLIIIGNDKYNVSYFVRILYTECPLYETEREREKQTSEETDRERQRSGESPWSPTVHREQRWKPHKRVVSSFL